MFVLSEILILFTFFVIYDITQISFHQLSLRLAYTAESRPNVVHGIHQHGRLAGQTTGGTQRGHRPHARRHQGQGYPTAGEPSRNSISLRTNPHLSSHFF